MFLGSLALVGIVIVMAVLWLALRARRENRRLSALLREGPVAHAACHAPSGADVVICPACAHAIAWATGRRPEPIYSDEIEEWWGGFDGLACNRCQQAILPPWQKAKTDAGLEALRRWN